MAKKWSQQPVTFEDVFGPKKERTPSEKYYVLWNIYASAYRSKTGEFTFKLSEAVTFPTESQAKETLKELGLLPKSWKVKAKYKRVS